ncbi:MAG: DUF6471 domain-containing protein [Hyphomicrobiaceae bacterium]
MTMPFKLPGGRTLEAASEDLGKIAVRVDGTSLGREFFDAFGEGVASDFGELGRLGSPETDRNISNKISRGGFTAAFFLQCLIAIGVQSLRLEDG